MATATLRESKKAAILEALRRGNTRRAAAAVAGITPETFYTWLREDLTLSDAVIVAEGEAEASLVGAIRDKAPEDWRAAESLLKRRFRDAWGDQVDLRKLPDEVLIRLLMGAMQQGSEALASQNTLPEPSIDAEYRVEATQHAPSPVGATHAPETADLPVEAPEATPEPQVDAGEMLEGAWEEAPEALWNPLIEE